MKSPFSQNTIIVPSDQRILLGVKKEGIPERRGILNFPVAFSQN